VENQGDGTVMQQSEVQEITFSAGIGIGGSATLTYSDLYGQSWTTRPINLGDGLHYVLDYALGTALTGAHTASEAFLALTYGGTKVVCENTHDLNTAALIREKLLGAATIGASTDLARSIRVTKRPDRTSHKFAGGIEANAKTTYDIYINPHLFDGLNEAGGLKAFTAELNGSSTQVADGKAYVNLRLASDASADIKGALEGLPNNVIPAVTVTKGDYTTPNTNDQATNGNAYHQVYRVTFSSSSNTGDQNMLSCDASPCDHDGCANRRAGVSSITYLHHDHTNAADAANLAISHAKVPRVNFENQGYFVIDIHVNTKADPAANAFSSGTAYVEWNTGSGVERAEFPIIATAATVQTSMRGITGWSGVTVTSSCLGSVGCAAVGDDISKAHSYTVKFPSGYDDGGQTPNVGLIAGFGGTAGSTATGAITVHDQRFSNSLWLGSITGWTTVECSAIVAGDPIGTSLCENQAIQSEDGDNYKMSIVQFGHAALTTSPSAKTALATFVNREITTIDKQLAIGTDVINGALSAFVMVDNTAAFPTKTSQNTGHYFAVGSTVEVLGTSWDTQDKDDDILANDIPNAYRTFKVLSHVSNVHGQTFAKLDSAPTTSTSPVNYALKVTTHNSTVTERTAVTVNGAKQEIQAIWSVDGNGKFKHTAGDLYRIYINANKPNVEFTEVLSAGSSKEEIQEAINSFSALSGPVSVAKGADLEIRITFAAIDGDVPQLTLTDEKAGGNADTRTVVTLVDGWSFFSGESARLSQVQPGSIINVTASEVVTFAITGWATGVNSNLYFAYDGQVGSTALAFAATFTTNYEVEAAINSIKDAKGLAKFALADNAATDGAATPGKPTSAAIQVTLPKGVDGSKLELFPAASITDATAITKSVAKNNNGKSFKVTRVVNQKFDLNGAGQGTHLATKYINTMNNKAAVVENDELKFTKSGAAICEAQAGSASTDENYDYHAVIYKTITDVTHTAATDTKLTFDTGIAAVTSACNFEVVRTTIVVDSVPDTLSAASVDLHITSPVGSCSVTEAVKGTYESDVCSSRGSCDGAAGLCTCHEGYSGEACETQTVLV
jgi:hypothetical protein